MVICYGCNSEKQEVKAQKLQDIAKVAKVAKIVKIDEWKMQGGLGVTSGVPFDIGIKELGEHVKAWNSQNGQKVE